MANDKKDFHKPANLSITGGRLGQDPDLRYVSSGMAVCNFSVCVNTRTKKDDPKNKAIWFDMVAFYDLAEHIASNYKKGSKIDVAEASPDLQQWQGRDGKEHKKTVWACWKITEDADVATGEAPPLTEPEPPMFDDSDSIPF